MNDILLIVIAIMFLILALFVVPRFMFQRAVKAVIRIFRQGNATAPENAKTAEELGVAPRNFFERLGRLRDYKPQAVEALVNAGIVKVTADGKLYLAEKELAKTRLGK